MWSNFKFFAALFSKFLLCSISSFSLVFSNSLNLFIVIAMLQFFIVFFFFVVKAYRGVGVAVF